MSLDRGVSSRALGRFGAALAFACAAAGARDASAGVAFDLMPSESLGLTNNASSAPPGREKADGFSLFSGTARAHTRTGRAEHSLGLRLTNTFYFLGRGPSTISAELASVSDFYVSRALQLRLAAGVAYSNTASPSSIDVNGGGPTVVPFGSNYYLSANATEEGAIEVGTRTHLVEALRFSGVDYVRSGSNAMTATGDIIDYSYVYGGELRLEREFGLSLASLQGSLDDSVVHRVQNTTGLPDQVLLANLLAGWRRDLGIQWSAQLAAGALGIFGTGVNIIEPSVLANIGYRRVAWFATLTASQSAMPNIFVAAATISDQITARLAIPLDQADRYYVMGYGGYIYARLAGTEGTSRGYELRAGGASFTARSERWPFWGSLDATVTSQLGNEPPRGNGTIPDIYRWVVLASVGYTYSTDHEAPPVFHGILPAINPLRRDEDEERERQQKAAGNVGGGGGPNGAGQGGPSSGGPSGSNGGPSGPNGGGPSGSGSGNIDNVTR
jgi:hypothetical protein